MQEVVEVVDVITKESSRQTKLTCVSKFDRFIEIACDMCSQQRTKMFAIVEQSGVGAQQTWSEHGGVIVDNAH